METVRRLLAACAHGSGAAEPLLAPGFVFEAGDDEWGRARFLRLIDGLAARGACLEADGLQEGPEPGVVHGRIKVPSGSPIAAQWRLEGGLVASFGLDALPGALQALLDPVESTRSGDRADRPGALAGADAPLRKVDAANIGPEVEAIKRMQDRQGLLQRPPQARGAPADPLDRQSELPRGPAHEGGWSRDQGAEQSGSSLDEEPNTRIDGTPTQGSYDGGRRLDPAPSGTHRAGGDKRHAR